MNKDLLKLLEDLRVEFADDGNWKWAKKIEKAISEASMYKYTPGPWEVLRVDGSYYGVFKDFGIETQALIAQTFDGNTEANARLIAAAPELLEALKCIQTVARDAASDNAVQKDLKLKGIFTLALGAIAKAEGK